MTRYHFNPETGESGACRAAPGNCPFLAGGSLHYDSLKEARRAYEESQEVPYVSELARLMVARSRLQRKIIQLWASSKEEGNFEVIHKLANDRDAIDRFSSELLPSSSERPLGPPAGRRRILHETLAKEYSEGLIGVSNEEESLLARPETYRAAFATSEEWLQRLSTEEANAVKVYSGNPERGREFTKLISDAIARAPRLEPTRVFSGLSVHVSTDVLAQLPSGRISLDYHISTSLNPAQANGFMRSAEFEGPKVAVEIETEVGGVMLAASHSPHEFEVLLPPGDYEVIEQKKNVKLIWNEGGAGLTADIFLKLRRVS